MEKSTSGDNQQASVTEIEKAWLAGIVDGEGSIRVDVPHGKVSGSPRVIVTNNDWAVIEKVVDICQRLGCNPHVQQRRGQRQLTKDVLILGCPKITILLTAIMAYLTGQKEKQAIMMFRFCQERNPFVLGQRGFNNRQKAYTLGQIQMIKDIRTTKHEVTQPQRLNARHESEDIVRTTQRCVEVARNEQPRLVGV